MQMDVQFGTSQVCRGGSHDDAALSTSIVLNLAAGVALGEDTQRQKKMGAGTRVKLLIRLLFFL